MSIQAGRELDALVAETVMTWVLGSGSPPFAFSTTWEGMRLVVERMRELGFTWQLYSADRVAEDWLVCISKFDGRCHNRVSVKKAPDLPHAVCLAALEAVGGERK